MPSAKRQYDDQIVHETELRIFAPMSPFSGMHLFTGITQTACELSALLARECSEETRSLLNFWINHLQDKEHGGFYGLMTNEGVIFKKHDKLAIQQIRALWAFAFAANTLKDTSYAVMAGQLFDYVLDTYMDGDFGGFIHEVDHTGNWTDARKYAYTQAFALFALCEYHRLTGSEQSLSIARDLFNQIELYFKTPDPLLFANARERNWSVADPSSLAPAWSTPMNIGVPLHLIEAYIPLYLATRDARVRQSLDDIATLFMDKLMICRHGLLPVHVDDTYNPLTSELRPGHDIELAWLLLDGIECFGPPIRERLSNFALESIDTVRKLVDRKTFTLPKIVKRRGQLFTCWVWWVQAELMTALWYAYLQTGSEHYLKECVSVWEFIKNQVRLPGGEWMHTYPIGSAGPRSCIAGPWKSLYHSVRATLLVGRGTPVSSE